MFNILVTLFNIFMKKNYKRGYFVHQIGSKNLLCKVLNEYENLDEAEKDLIYLVTNRITEKQLEKSFLTKKSW